MHLSKKDRHIDILQPVSADARQDKITSSLCAFKELGYVGCIIGASYRKLLFVFLFDSCSVVVAHWGGLVGKVEAIFALATVAASAESQSRNVYTLNKKTRISVSLCIVKFAYCFLKGSANKCGLTE